MQPGGGATVSKLTLLDTSFVFSIPPQYCYNHTCLITLHLLRALSVGCSLIWSLVTFSHTSPRLCSQWTVLYVRWKWVIFPFSCTHAILNLQLLSSRFFSMAALRNRAGHYIFALWFLLSIFFPRLISAVADWMSTMLPHSANLRCRSETFCTRLAKSMAYRTQKIAIWTPSHNFVGLYLRNYKARINNRKKNLLDSNISPTCPH